MGESDEEIIETLISSFNRIISLGEGYNPEAYFEECVSDMIPSYEELVKRGYKIELKVTK